MTTYVLAEREMTDSLISELRNWGWLVHHSRPAQTDRGWRTALQGHAGLPDILAVKDGKLLAWEVKGPRGTATEEQQAWLAALARVPGVDALIVTPENYEAALYRIVGQESA